MSKLGEKKIGVENAGFDLDDLVGGCLSDEMEYGLDWYGVANDAQYFKLQDKKYSNEVSITDSVGECGNNNRRKRGRVFDLFGCKEWWKGKSELSRKLFLKEILEKDVGLDAMPPSFVAGCLAYQRRREKIKAAKLRIDKIICPQNNDSGDNGNLCISEGVCVGKKRRREGRFMLIGKT
ncbi:hypothetical protein Vadar_034251 [Vaccinium darrowii]|uniref:Uncharacterized protein n=1 Tax=Vaccinium darrowii TaxID=229202 RepID=A0ACB7XEB3_9ERIC|nr:hypothetical protein Vadar_034251 [Vaccinium darrowii]